MPLLRPCLSSTLLTPLSRPALRTFTTTASRPLANINLVGRLAAEPELTPTSSGTDMIRYSLGTGHGNRENRSTSWWKVACFLPEGSARDALLSLGKGYVVSCSIEWIGERPFREKLNGQNTNPIDLQSREEELRR